MTFFKFNLSRIFSAPEEMDERLKTRLSPWELFALLLGMALAAIFYWSYTQGGVTMADLTTYLRAGHGDYRYYYYGYWFLPVFTVLDLLPLPVAYLIWTALNLGGVWFAARVFGARPALVLLSYQMIYLIFYGEISGVLIGALGLLAWAVAHRRWNLAGLGLLIAATKPQTGALLGLFYLLCAPIQWKERMRVLVVPVIGGLLSLLVYPGWPLNLLATLRAQPADALGSISLWQWLGPWCLALWLPPIVLRTAPEKRFLMLMAANMLALPYFQQADLLAMFVMPLGGLPLLGNLGYFFLLGGWDFLRWLFILPLGVYVFCLIPGKKVDSLNG